MASNHMEAWMDPDPVGEKLILVLTRISSEEFNGTQGISKEKKGG
jgi:hypothetical protein